MIEIAKRQADSNVVEVLRALLEKAEAGDIVAMAVATEHTGRDIGTAYAGDISVFTMLGALEHLKWRISEELL